MTETTIEPFLRNAWYLGAWPEELADGDGSQEAYQREMKKQVSRFACVAFLGGEGECAIGLGPNGSTPPLQMGRDVVDDLLGAAGESARMVQR